MDKTIKWLTAGIFFLGVSILVSGLIISFSTTGKVTAAVMNIEEASDYLDISEEKLISIIIWENAHPEYFDQEVMRLPYYIVDNSKFFNEIELDAWIHNVSTRGRMKVFISINEGWR